jgi:NADH-quinone oxidoreductase subunit L
VNRLRRIRYPTAQAAAAPVGLRKVLYDKWYVDEAYDAVVVQPILATSRALWRFIDQGLIDGIANGAGYTARALGWVGSRLQTGQVNTYAFAVLVGALLLLAFAVL